METLISYELFKRFWCAWCGFQITNDQNMISHDYFGNRITHFHLNCWTNKSTLVKERTKE